MKKRQLIITGLGVVILLAGIAGNKFLKSLKTPPPRKEAEGITKQVPVRLAEPKDLPVEIEITGKLNSADKTQIYAEVSGIMRPGSKPFKEGTSYAKGELMLSIEDDETRLTLLSQKSDFLNLLTQALPDLKFDFPERAQKWSDYLANYHIDKPIPALPAAEDEKEKYFLAARNIYNKYYTVKSLEAKVGKFLIRAPFNGTLVSSLINPGTLVRTGQLMGEFIGSGSFELEASVPRTDLEYIAKGSPATLTGSSYDNRTYPGRVVRISNKIDERTQSAKIILSVTGNDLQDGMFMNGTLSGKKKDSSVYLSRKLINGDHKIYVVKDSVLQLLPVKVVRSGKTKSLVQDIPTGTAIVTEPVPGAYEGMSVAAYPAAE